MQKWMWQAIKMHLFQDVDIQYNLYLNFAVNILKNVFLIKDHCKYVKLNS